MPDATCVFNPAGDALMVNDPFLRVFGADREGVLGKFNLFRHADFLQCDMNERMPLLKKGETVVIDQVRVEFTGGRVAYLSFKIFPTFSQDGTIYSYISICEDVTARAKTDEELKRAKALAELYIDLMGHDINNINQVGMGYLEIALNTMDVEEDKKKLLAKPLEAMKNSSRLIDNVKKLRRANEGAMHLRPIDMSKLMMDVIAEYGQAPDREVVIHYDAADNAMVMANELLKDVFANLVSNAIKHSEGAVHINIRQEEIEADGKKYYRVLVEDDGPGIPEELKPVIFDRILRRHARIGSTGIGLYLVKTLIDNYGGSIAVEDRMPGERVRGTRFIVTLPAA
jgi:PAS domain S-box-containing protein